MRQRAMREPERPWPSRMAELADAERLVLRALRLWSAGLTENTGAYLALAWNDLARELGAARGRAAMSGLTGLAREMRHLRRPLRHHRPCCPCVTGDEVALLGFLAACQDGSWVLARGQAEWLVRAEGVGGLLECGARLATALGESGLILPARLHRAARPEAIH